MRQRIFSCGLFAILCLCIGLILFPSSAPAEQLVTRELIPAKDNLSCFTTAGVVQGVDTNPLLDSTKKADNYTEEDLDMHFKYKMFEVDNIGQTSTRFGFNVTNVNYYNLTDINTFDSVADVKLEQEVFDFLTLNAGYAFEVLCFPNDRYGTYLGNEINFSARHKIFKALYQKFTYRMVFKNFTDRKAHLSNGNLGSPLRADMRNILEHEGGIYFGDKAKLRIVNQALFNNSNDQFMDYYDYFQYKIGGSFVYLLTDKLYSVTGFYYQRKNYDSRWISVRNSNQRDNFYLVTTSLSYDITKNLSISASYMHTENHTNEPLEEYTDSIYTGGIYYSF